MIYQLHPDLINFFLFIDIVVFIISILAFRYKINIRILVLICATWLLLFGVPKIFSRIDCFLASSPVDLEIRNQTNQHHKLYFLISDLEDNYSVLKISGINENGFKTICFENEGNIINGLFIFFDKTLHQIYLDNNVNPNKFTIDKSINSLIINDKVSNVISSAKIYEFKNYVSIILSLLIPISWITNAIIILNKD